jgi:tetratricopeptide (TPR) repeat protein
LHAIFERLAKADPGNAGWQRDLSLSQGRIGDVLVNQGHLAEALTTYQASLAIAERLAKADPGNAGWQSNLSVSHNKIGDVLKDQGNLPAALESFRASLAIAESLAKADPGTAGWWQHELSETLSKVASVQMMTGKLEEALANYTKALAAQEKLASVVELDDIKSGGKAGRATARELGGVSWYALFTRDYAKALASADRALTIAPDELWIVMHRAHALMLVGRIKEARRLYLAHKDERLANNEFWQQGVAKDFSTLRKAGVTNRLMPKIERVLGVQSK